MAVSFEIHPAIGIARAGKSDEHFVFAGPASDQLPRRDVSGNLLRQAAEFRVYRCERDAAGQITSAVEMTGANSAVKWTVRLANRKATAKRRFTGPAGSRRNNAAGNDVTDKALIIDSKDQSVSSPNQSKDLKGEFGAKSVSLGRISMTANGRLLVIGSDGSAESPAGISMTHFADNDGWYDTMGDGVIRAQITPTGEQPVDALAAWVIVAPPDYAPPVTNIVTMYDVVLDTAIARGVHPAPSSIGFKQHIRPVLERAMGYQWVTSTARQGYDDEPSGAHSPGGAGDFSSLMTVLSDPTKPASIRQSRFQVLRDPDGVLPLHPNERKRMPRLNDDEESGGVFPLTRTQYRAMKLWADGTFVADAPVTESEPDRLTREALESCAGGPFFPGIEAGLIMRQRTLYMGGEAFRISPDNVKPGEVTQANAVPWQADFSACRWEGSGQLGWWPAQRPDDVLASAIADPVRWTRGTPDNAKGMLDNWQRYGFVKETPPGSGVFIEQERDPTLPNTGVA